MGASNPTLDRMFRKAGLSVVQQFKARLEARKREQAAAGTTAGEDGILDCPDPVKFFREWLHIEPWPRQEDILRGVAASSRVVVRSGRKTGKSTSAAGLALWWAKTQPMGRVVFTAPTARQTEEIVWRELTLLHARAAQHGRPLGGRLYRRPDGGLRYPDGREVVGFSTDQAEKFQGWSGRLLFIVDEGSGVSDPIYDAIFGNAAGGGSIFKEGDERRATEVVESTKVAVFGNPTKTSGRFYRAFRDQKEADLWNRIHISSEEAAEHQAKIGKKIGALATYEYVEDMRQAYGAESPFFFVHVKGDFALHAEGHLISMNATEAARARWLRAVEVLERFSAVGLNEGGETTIDTYKAFEAARRELLNRWNELGEEEQALCESLRRPLRVGVDVAWFGTDLSVICPRRGDFVFPLMALQTMDGPEVAFKVAEVVRALRGPSFVHDPWNEHQTDDKPCVNFDSCGNGVSAFDTARHQHGEEFRSVGINVSTKATDEESATLRDQVWCAARDFLKDGGMLPPDDLLEAELQAPEYGPSSRNKLKVDDKDTIKSKLPEGRSPDRADAFCLAVFEPTVFVTGASRPDFDRYA